MAGTALDTGSLRQFSKGDTRRTVTVEVSERVRVTLNRADRNRGKAVRNLIFAFGQNWRIEEPDPLSANPRRRMLYALWRSEPISAGTRCRRWMFVRLMTRQEAERYGRGNPNEVR